MLKHSYPALVMAMTLFLSCCMVYLLGWSKLGHFAEFIATSPPHWGHPTPAGHLVDYPDSPLKTKVSEHTMRVDEAAVGGPYQKHLILAGDSNTFGWKLTDSQYLGGQLKRRQFFSDYQIATLAYPGWGPAHVLERFKALPYSQLNFPPQGTFILNLLDINLERVCGSPSYFSWSGGRGPNYQLTSSGKWQYDGLFNQTGDFHYFLLQNGLKKLTSLWGATYRYETDLTLVEDSSCLQKIKSIILELKQTYLTAYPQGRFVVVLFSYWERRPVTRFSLKMGELLTQGTRMEVFDINQFLHAESQLRRDDLFQNDWHFTAQMHSLFANYYQQHVFKAGLK